MESWRKFLNEEDSFGGKAIFMAGAPGAGKSTVIDKLGLENMEVINPDEFYEPALEKAGLGKNIAQIKADFTEARQELKDLLSAILQLQEPEDGWKHDILMEMYQNAFDEVGEDRSFAYNLTTTKEKYDAEREKIVAQAKLFAQARRDAKEKQASTTERGGNFIIDGTGGQFGVIRNQKTKLEEDGYEVAMIFVDVPLETAIDRQASRGAEGGRTLDTKAIEKSWAAINKNIGPYEELFGNNFFHIIATNEEMDDSIAEAQPEISRFMTGQQLNEADWQKWVRANYNKQVGAYTRGGKNKTKPTGWEEAPIDYRGSAPPGASGG